ncbi:hypothetical protein MRX96_039644 [Rhipicephalus microplus]
MAAKTKSEVRSFLGIASHYRKYIKDFAKIARPLALLTKKDAIVQWMPESQGAMDTLKQRLTEPPILTTFNPNLPTQVHVDASHTALGAVLTHTHGDTTQVVEYASKKVSDRDSDKHSTELEAIAAHWAITERFHRYLQGLEHFELITDNWAVTHIMSKKNPNRRFARMVLDLSTYHFTVRHTSGKTNTGADTLSRMVNAVFVLRANDSRLCEVQRKDAKLVTIVKTSKLPLKRETKAKLAKATRSLMACSCTV